MYSYSTVRFHHIGAKLVPEILENVTTPEQYELLEMSKISGFVDRARGTGLNKNSRSHLSLADAPIFKDAEAVMALPEVTTAYTTDLKKLTFDKSKMPPIGKAVEALKNLHEILVKFEKYRTIQI